MAGPAIQQNHRAALWDWLSQVSSVFVWPGEEVIVSLNACLWLPRSLPLLP